MKNKRVFRLLTSLLAVVLCTTAFSVTAFAGGGEGYYEPPTVDDTVKTLLPLAQNKDIQIRQNIGTDKTLLVNPALWSKALSNIIGNAVKYSPNGAEVSIFLRDKNVLVVENTGVTIPEDDLPHLFTPFYRTDKSRYRATGGSGLGLYIVKTILDLHGMTCCIHNTQNSVAFEIRF